MMSEKGFVFGDTQFNRLFPFYVLINKELKIESAGKSLLKLRPDVINSLFSDNFKISRPTMPVLKFEELKNISNETVVLETLNYGNTFLLRGQMEFLSDQNCFIFLGSLWVDSVDEIVKNKLSISDFSIQDATIDLLHVVKAQENVSTDLKEILDMLNKKTVELKVEREELLRLSSVASLNSNGVLFLNNQGEILWINEGFRKITGYSTELVKGKKIFELGNQTVSTKKEMERFLLLLKSKNNLQSEVLLTKENGKQFWGQVKGQYLTESFNKQSEFFIIIEDVTSKKLSAQRLQESERLLSSLISNINAGILVEGGNRLIMLANPLFCQMFDVHLSPDTLVGLNPEQSLKNSSHLFKYPEQVQAQIEQLVKNQKIVIGDEIEFIDGRIISRDYIPIYIDQARGVHLWKFTDITAQKLAEQSLVNNEKKYRSIIANMQLGLMEVDLDQKIQFVNNSFCEMSGYCEEDLLGRVATEIFVDDNSRNASLQQNEIRKQGISDAYELYVKKKSNEYRWWLISGAPRFNDQGEIIGSLGIHLDITPQKEVEQKLLQAKEIAERSQQAEQEFLANMSHEIRTPLNAIAGMGYLLQDTPLQNEQKEFLDVIQSSTDILLRLVTNILDISKIEAGKIEMHLKEMDVIQLLKGLEKTFRIQHTNSQVKINFQYPDSPVQYVWSDDLLLSQIMLNILSNASKFTSRGEIKLNAAFLPATSSDDLMLNVVISDTGKGMSKDEQMHIFDKYMQAGDAESRSRGTGLGLAITKRLVELLDGSIDLESYEGVGTSFNILVPLKKGKDFKNIIKPEIKTFEWVSLKGHRVLVAEDNDVNRTYIGRLLIKWQIEFEFAYDGNEVLELLHSGKKFDLILMDLQMPEKDGIEATIEIRNSNYAFKDIPIIGVSATAVISLMQKARESGINDFVTKPYSPIQLQAAIEKFIVQPQQNYSNSIEENTEKVFVFDPFFDATYLNDLIAGDYSHAMILFDIFEKTVPSQIEEAKKAIENLDVPLFAKVIHKIKPAFTMVGIAGFEPLLRRMELDAIEGKEHAIIEEQFNEFLRKAEEAIPMLIKEKNRLTAFIHQVEE